MGEAAEKLSFLEELVGKLAYTQLQVNMSVDRFAREMRDFKDEMSEFKDEMNEFKDEMREFKNEMGEYKDWSKKQIIAITQQIDTTKQETDKQIENLKLQTDKQIENLKQQTDKQIESLKQHTDRQVETTKQQISAMNRQWGDLANKMGTVVEDIVAPNIPRIAKEYFGCGQLDYIAIRVKKRNTVDKSKRREFDAIAVCDGVFILNETKSSPETRDVEKFAAFVNSSELFEYFPEYRGYKIYPIFSSLYLDESFITYLSTKGIYALTMNSDTMEIVNFNTIKNYNYNMEK